jgi:MFS family permease
VPGRALFLDLGPLRTSRDYRLLYTGQFVSFIGSQLSVVALPYQVYQLTHSSLAVGMIGLSQLVPLVVFGLVGGVYADALDRRRVLIAAESALLLLCGLLIWNACRTSPAVWPLYALAALRSALNGFHRPAIEALSPRLVGREAMPAVAALNSLRGNVGMIGGPTLAGIILDAGGSAGPAWAYSLDALSFALSLLCLWQLRPPPPPAQPTRASLRAVLEGLRYAASRQELLGTYVVDMVAMIFGMPMALLPAIADSLGGARVLGSLYAAPSVGALAMTLLSGWTKQVRRHGVAITIAAALWGVSIVGFGYARSVPVALLCLGLAGAADMVSALFRSTVWNQTIPDKLRGRMASVEMISYMSGPQLGNAEAGLVAAWAGVPFSVISGGVLCVLGVGVCAVLLPRFWTYDSDAFVPEE